MFNKKIITFSILFVIFAFIDYLQILNQLQFIALFLTMVTAIFWITEWLPIPVASLIPVALFPLLGVISSTQVAQSYGSPLILLLLGGFLLSTAMAHSNTHLLIAHRIIRLVGADKPEKLLLSFMLTAFLLSMWISNTATTLMLLPIAIAITNKVEDPKFTIILLLGIAYAASIGGSSTPIGTPPNLIMIQNYQEATGIELGFVQWMKMVLPVVLIFLPIMYFVLKSSITKNNIPMNIRFEKQTINTAQKRTLAVFLITAVLWMSRTAPFGGWKSWLNLPQANDASVALLAVIAMFIIPAGNNKKLLDWKTANQIPWGILLLFAGGITIATAFKSTGLSGLIAEQLMFLKHLPIWLIIFIICLAITFLTEITSNTATTAIMMPILVSAAIAMDINPIKLMLPATISASCAFMLPVATAPNAIIYSSEKVPIKSMLKFGFKLNLIGAVIITIVSSFML